MDTKPVKVSKLNKTEPVVVGDKQIALCVPTSHEHSVPVLCFALTAQIRTELLQAQRIFAELDRKYIMVTGLQCSISFKVIWGTPCLPPDNDEADWVNVPLDYAILPIMMTTTHYVAGRNGIEFFGEHEDIPVGYVCTPVLPWSTIEDADL